MERPLAKILLPLALCVSLSTAYGQADEICAEAGLKPSLDSPFAHVPYVYGRVLLRGPFPNGKTPTITVTLADAKNPNTRLMVGQSGNYCFRLTGNDSTIIVQLDGLEVARRSLPGFGASQQREDFEVQPNTPVPGAAPGTLSVKFTHPRNEKTVELYRRAAEAERNKEVDLAVKTLREIVTIDAADFIGWAQLGTLLFGQNSLTEAEAALRKSLELRVDYTPAWINVGKLRMHQKQFEAAIEIFKHAVELEPRSARGFQLLGEAYLQARKGTLGVEALNKALEIDPLGMAECHLLKARLYDLAGAKHLAAEEYKAFLAKVSDHPDKKKFEKYIKDNPE